MGKIICACLLLPSMLLLSACGSSKSHQLAPVVSLSNKRAHNAPRQTAQIKNRNTINKQGEYYVQNGDTLFSIARKTGHDPQHLAILNGINPPYKIMTGQKIRFANQKSLAVYSNNSNNPDSSNIFHTTSEVSRSTATGITASKPGGIAKQNHTTAATATTTTLAAARGRNISKKNNNEVYMDVVGTRNLQNPSPSKSSKNAVAPLALNSSSTTPKIKNNENQGRIPNNIHWRWPVQGRILRSFQGIGKGKGIDIAGTSGKPIKAAAEGVVVYSGNGLKGYGNLIIIKHNEDFLSAYAHNRELRVKEGERVRLGQEIALMGQTDAEQVKVHFEIRYKGKPVNPLGFLPKN